MPTYNDTTPQWQIAKGLNDLTASVAGLAGATSVPAGSVVDASIATTLSQSKITGLVAALAALDARITALETP